MQTEAIFDEVEYKNIDINRIKIDWNRLNSRFSKSFDIAILILKKLIALPSKGSNRNFAFLFDMAEVFEEFVGKVYKSVDKTTVLQKQRNFGSLVLKPDIITNSCIIDTKYKKLSKRDELSTQDKYQMFVYGINLKQQSTMLLYSKHLADIDDNLELGTGDNLINLRLKSLDLGFEGGYMEYIEEMKKRIREIT